jgi:RNA polymerase sigma factor (sigma-70 family)
MSSAQVGAVLRHIRQLAAARHDPERPDHQLLERFARHRDGDAFAALLRRHGPMVLGVCHSVLHNVHDAEDAFQAAFLLLARKAGSIRRREAVSGWLYRVAYRLAVRARATAARRRVHERRAAAMPPADPVLDLSLREVRAVLLEELDGLPEQYRAPLVLCALEEKSREEAARLLGWSPSAVKGKLERGRELLRARLRRRGLVLSSGLCAAALALGSAPGRVSAALAESTLRAAVKVAAGGGAVAGVVLAEVAALVQGASQTMCTSKAKIATALVLAVSVAAAACGVGKHQAAAADKPAPEQSRAAQPQEKGEPPPPDARPQPAADVTIEVRGQVLDPDGKPVAGARLYLAKATPKGPAPSPRATSGDDGRFKFPFFKSELDKTHSDNSVPRVIAVAEGHGCAWVKVGSAEKELTLRLVQDVPIRGRILDPDGKPVAGAKLTMIGVCAAKGGDLGYFLGGVSVDRLQGLFEPGWAGPVPGRPAVLTTGADGRFKLAGVGRDRFVLFRLEGPGISTAEFAVVTRAGEKDGRLYGASFDYLASASRPIRGMVRDKDTRKPVPGVTIEGHGKPYVGLPTKAVTDKEGRYELLGLAKSPRYQLEVKPPDGLYFQRRAELTDTEGLGPLNGDVEMVQGGVTVRGKVMDKATGKPIAKARVDYHPLWQNPNVARTLPGLWYPRSETTTGPDGSYTLTVFRGAGVIGVAAPRREAYMPAWLTLKERKDFFKVPLFQDNNESFLSDAVGENLTGTGIDQVVYNALVLLEPGEKDEALVKDVALEAPRELKGRVVGPDGKPVSGTWVMGLFGFDEETLQGAEFTVRGLNPKMHGRQLVFFHKDKNLGFFVKELRGDRSEPLTIKLQPCGSFSGQLVDPGGQPLAQKRVGVQGGVLFGRGGYQEVKTDKEGRFRAEGLVPGQGYRVFGYTSPRDFANVVVEPGQHKDLGDIKVRDD